MIAKDNTVKEIDNEINISYKNFIAEFQKNSKLEDNLKVENLDLENLIDYINNNHHKHIKASISLIQDHLAKISETHNYHEITTVLNLFIKLILVVFV